MSSASGPPYAPTTSILGGIPNLTVDVPICAVFIALYLSCAATSASIFKANLNHGHRFFISAMFTGFCMARVLTCALRISWATRLDNVSLGIAATLFNNVGVFLLYIVNVIFALRILRAKKPGLGWHRALHHTMTAIYTGIGLAAVVVISFTVLGYYTRDKGLLTAVRDLQLTASTYLLLFVLIPYAALAIAWLRPASANDHQHFGHGSLEIKSLLLLLLTTLMALLQGYKYGIAWLPATYPINDLPWYHSKTAFYCFGFMLEILYLISVLSLRVDLRFHVPNGSSKRRSFVVESEANRNDAMRHSEDTLVHDNASTRETSKDLELQ